MPIEQYSIIGIVFGIGSLTLLGLLVWTWHRQANVKRQLLELTRLARDVAEHSDYTGRAAKSSAGTLGELTDAFNAMLKEMAGRTEALERSNQQFAKAVAEHKGLDRRFQQAVESAPNAMVMVNRQGQIVLLNAQAEKLFGYAREELFNQSIEVLVPERFRGGHSGYRQAFFQAPSTRAMGPGRDLYARRKDGSELPVEIGLNSIDTDEGPLVLAAIIDISERKGLDRRFQQAVESAPNAMVMVNHQGQIVLLNAQAEKLFGYAREELLGQSIESLVPERYRGGHSGYRQGFFHAPSTRTMGPGRDLYALRKDGSELPVEIGLNSIDTDEGPVVLAAVIDISERKQREEHVRAALREKELLLGEIHHRVKNNLQLIDSLIDLQTFRVQDAEALAALRDSQNRIRSMLLIHQTLYLSKDFARVDLQAFLKTLLPALMESYTTPADRVELHIDAEQVQLPINAAVPCGLVVNELVTNSLKHAFPGELRGNIWVELSLQPDGEVRLSISNDGVPIPDDLDFSRSTSLGMKLVSLLTEQMQGRLEIQRAAPTRFLVQFPLEGR